MKKRVKVSTLPQKTRKASLPSEKDILQVGLPDEVKSIKQRQTHEVFVELDELEVHDNHLIWKERARWIKFEEDVEDNDRWSKPHIASLSFLALWEVRKGMEKGLVLLDCESFTLPGVAGDVVSAMAQEDLIRDEDRLPIMNALLLKHESDRQESDWTHLLSSAVHKPIDELHLDHEIEQEKVLFDEEELKTASKTHFFEKRLGSMKKPKIMDRIPDDAEASIVLVGKMNFLKQPVMAFVRLSEAREMGEVVSVPLPVRFIFILLGPEDSSMDYHEIGRAISTLMSNTDFHNKAYMADTKRDLLKAIKYFLDDAIVLPPGQLEDPNLLRSIQTFQKEISRKKMALEIMAEKANEGDKINPLHRTGRPFGATWNDLKNRYSVYCSDIKDGFNTQCLAASIFLYFAILSPAITFGGLLGAKTNNAMGVSETLMGSAIAGIIGALTLGQPLLVLGMTGPNVVFEEALYKFCEKQEMNFMSVRVWTGFWILLLSVLCSGFEGSHMLAFLSRFTEEIFSILISLIFIYETFKKLAKTFQLYPLLYLDNQIMECVRGSVSDEQINDTSFNVTLSESDLSNVLADQTVFPAANLTSSFLHECQTKPNTALLSTLLCLGCFTLAMGLRKFRGSNFLRSSARRLIGDFGVPIAILVFVLIDFAMGDVYTEKLSVPNAIEVGGIFPTDLSQRGSSGKSGTGWVINPMDPFYKLNATTGIITEVPFKPAAIGWAMLFAFLCFILLFVESQVAELIISGPDRKLKKGVSYHLNMLVVGLINGCLSVFGCPWICAASVRTLTHLNAVTQMSQNDAPGEKPKIVGAREQRLTGLVSHLMLGLSVLLGVVLQEVPTSVLFGIFLYMGIVSLNGLQLFDRLLLLFIPAKHHPDYRYVRKMKPLRVHLFTLIQLICLGVLWAVKSTSIAIAFPFFLVLCVPIRLYLLPLIFTKRELTEIDNETLDDVFDDHDDAYAESHAVPSQFTQLNNDKKD